MAKTPSYQWDIFRFLIMLKMQFRRNFFQGKINLYAFYIALANIACFVCIINVCRRRVYKTENSDIKDACIWKVFTLALKDCSVFGECIGSTK